MESLYGNTCKLTAKTLSDKKRLIYLFFVVAVVDFCALHLPVRVLERFIAFTITRTWSQKDIVGKYYQMLRRAADCQMAHNS